MMLRTLLLMVMAVVGLNMQAQGVPKIDKSLLQLGKSPAELLEQYGVKASKKPDKTWEIFVHYEVEFEDADFEPIIGTKDKPGPLRLLGPISSLSLYDTQLTSKSMALIAELEGVEELILSGTVVDSKGMKSIATMQSLKFLMPGKYVSDEGIAYLSGHPNIVSLDLQTCHMTDAGIDHLAKLPKLRELNISNQTLTVEGLEKLRKISTLEILNIDSADLTDDHLVGLSGIRTLKRLSLCENESLTGSGFEKITGLDSLETLVIYQVPIQGEHLKNFAHFPKLKNLWLHGIMHRFDLRDALALSEMKNLRNLMVGESRKDEQAEAEIKTAMPNLKVVYAGE